MPVLRQSGLMGADQLAALDSRLTPGTPASQLGRYLIENGLLTRWQWERIEEGRAEGFHVGDYICCDRLDAGAISAVFEARHARTGVRVALKILLPHLASMTSYLERFQREARAAMLLRHPNVVRVLEAGCVDYGGNPLHFMATEFFGGKNLEWVVSERGRLHPECAADYIRQAAKGLALAHSHGIVHRNLKPKNLLLDEGLVKVANLGVARFLNDEEEESLSLCYGETLIGTAAYMSPEQIFDSHTVDARTDLYALGCNLYYFLTGQPPFPDASGTELLLNRLQQTPRAAHEVRPDVPESLSAICQRLLARLPGERYPSADHLAVTLNDWLLRSAIAEGRARARSEVGGLDIQQEPGVLQETDALQEAVALDSVIGLPGDETVDDIPREAPALRAMGR